VQSGEEALMFLARCPVDVLLLDLHMPGTSGIETLLA
jgi:CheY-like chemotaxis protein